MAKLILTAAQLLLNTVDRSSWVTNVELAVDAEAKDVTVFTSGGFKENLSGLKSGNLAVTWDNDLAAGSLDELMWALFIASAAVSFEVRAVNTARSTSNPGYTGSVILTGWTPISGAPGDVNGFNITYPTTGAVVRNVV
jgi:hypothetical protein